tara:strand:+ start:246 stop:563 length:318 start_codon:yes stop_codon:yes gene_type:complete
MKIKGKLKEILKLETGVSKIGKEWKKQRFLLDTGSDFNNILCIDVFGDKIDQITNLKLGVEIECKLNVSSREYNGKYYHNVSAWDIVLIENSEVSNTNDFDNVPF